MERDQDMIENTIKKFKIYKKLEKHNFDLLLSMIIMIVANYS